MRMMVLLLAALYSGRPLVDALHDLETKGLRIIYSDDVVSRQMMVKKEPRSTQPRQILDELLEPHHLRAVPGPQDTILIVRAEPEEKAAMPVTLAEIVVTPSRFEILAQEPEARQFLSREEVRRVPHLSDDLFRAIARVPGTTSSDVTSRPNIRGGIEDEVSVLVDGVEVYDPFHLKDLFRAFSTIDAEAVGAVDVLTGGYPSEYGGRMSGVIDVDTLAPTKRRTEIGISLLNTRLLSQGTFREDRGEWLLSFRRGYLREMLRLVDDSEQLDPRYYDALGKLQWRIGNAAIVSAHVLAANDTLRINEVGEKAGATSRDEYFWLNIRGAPNSRLFLQSVASIGQLRSKRNGTYGGENFGESGRVDDARRSRILALKNDATFTLTPRNVIKGGLTVRSVRGRYEYHGAGAIQFNEFVSGGPRGEFARSADVEVSGTEVSMYVADRVRVSDRLVAEVGARVDRATQTPDGTLVNPRVNIAWGVGERTSVRAAWGRFAQTQAIYELQVEDGVTEFARAQRAEHRVLGLDHAFARGMTARLELYDKRFTNLRPRYENIFNRVILFPELRHDRIRIEPDRALARGAELLLRTDASKSVSGWFSYTRSEVTDHIDGRDVPRSWDQRDAITYSVNYRRGTAWNFNLAGTWHTGWPTTPVVASVVDNRLVVETGPLNSSRLPSYRRTDLRVSRNVPAGRGVVSFFVELFNVFNQSNVVRVNSFDVFPNLEVRPQYESLFGVIPSFGVTWQF